MWIGSLNGESNRKQYIYILYLCLSSFLSLVFHVFCSLCLVMFFFFFQFCSGSWNYNLSWFLILEYYPHYRLQSVFCLLISTLLLGFKSHVCYVFHHVLHDSLKFSLFWFFASFLLIPIFFLMKYIILSVSCPTIFCLSLRPFVQLLTYIFVISVI